MIAPRRLRRRPPASWLADARWMAAVLAAGRGAALSHRSAGALWRLRPSARPLIEVTAERRILDPRRGIQPHRGRLPQDEVTIVRGIPVTTVPRDPARPRGRPSTPPARARDQRGRGPAAWPIPCLSLPFLPVIRAGGAWLWPGRSWTTPALARRSRAASWRSASMHFSSITAYRRQRSTRTYESVTVDRVRLCLARAELDRRARRARIPRDDRGLRARPRSRPCAERRGLASRQDHMAPAAPRLGCFGGGPAQAAAAIGRVPATRRSHRIAAA